MTYQPEERVYIKPIRIWGNIIKVRLDERGVPLVDVRRDSDGKTHVCREYELRRPVVTSLTNPTTPYAEHFSAEEQISTEEEIASLIYSYQEEQIEKDPSAWCEGEQLYEEDCADLSRIILYHVLRRFRPDLIEEKDETL